MITESKVAAKVPRMAGLIALLLLAIKHGAPLAFGQTNSSLKQTAVSQSPTGKKNRLAWHRARFHGNRKIAIRPAPQPSGISTGLVIAYGHVIPPPYQIEFVSGRLLVNGIQVQPSLILEREKPAVRSTLSLEQQEQSAKGSLLIAAAKKMYRADFGKKSIEDIHAEITALIAKSPDVYINPKWSGNNVLEVQSAVDKMLDIIEFSNVSPMSIEEQHKLEAAGSKKSMESHLAMVRKALEAGDPVIFTSDGGESYERHDFRSAVNQIMAEPGLSETQRVEKLANKVFSDYNLAVDVIDNYDAGEWRVK